jgi:hypothetical protein
VGVKNQPMLFQAPRGNTPRRGGPL